MRIQHNIMAMNAYRNYTNNTSALSKNLEKLSSGYKINRAGDDAAGLAISRRCAPRSPAWTRPRTTPGRYLPGADRRGRPHRGPRHAQPHVGWLSSPPTAPLRTAPTASSFRREVTPSSALRSDHIADSANFNGINLLDGSMEDGATITRLLELLAARLSPARPI